MEQNKIYLGLDLGTESCGWAVTNENYEIIKMSGKHLHGVRKFIKAESAEKRRLKRSARRRLERRKFRLEILQSFFMDEVSKVDSNFFLRLNNSFFNKDDKDKDLGKFSLFNDKLFTDKEYYKKFKTIFHLRDYLLSATEKVDIRLVYLACHNILKYRGNFLMQGISLDSDSVDYGSVIRLFADAVDSVNDIIGDEETLVSLSVNEDDIDKMLNVINDTASINDRVKRINQIINPDNTSFNKKLIELILGKTVQLKDLFSDDKYSEVEHPKIKFSDSKFESDIEPILPEMIGEAADAIMNAKRIYNWLTVKNFLKDSHSISQAKVREFNAHHEDLLSLKKFIRRFFNKAIYDNMFRISDSKIKNYVAYVKTNLINNKKEYVKSCSYEEFLKTLKKLIKDFEEKYKVDVKSGVVPDTLNSNDYNLYFNIKTRVENQEFLPKQRITTNGVIPYQLHYNELSIILDKAASHYDFISNKDEDGISVKDKILELMKFRIPYYIGPLNDAHKEVSDSGFAWVNRLEKGRVLPWNFDKKVDVDKSAEEFITRMTRKCTYLNGKDVLPKHSLLYSEYRVLNELNNLQINKEPISIELKRLIVKDLFKKEKKVTQKRLKDYLFNEGHITNRNDLLISGIDGDFKNSMSSYISFSKIFGDFDQKNEIREMIERIIFILTIFEDKQIADRKIKKEYPKLSKDQLSEVRKLNFMGWGNLSREFLETEVIRVDDSTGQVFSIISTMRDENLNLQSVLYDTRYNFMEKVQEINGAKNQKETLTYEELMEDVYVSPGIKRSLWQALKIVDEVKKIIKKPIDKFFVEVARGGGEKGKPTNSRKYKIESLYAKAKIDANLIIKMKNELSRIEDNSRLKGEKLFLYFMQLGKCMYTGEDINIDKLDSSEYDIDHIIPRAYLKDDSFTNKVLVTRNSNAIKKDDYPIDNSIINSMIPFWKKLRSIDLLTEEKFKRLTRSNDLSPKEKGDFVNRQLVYTNQAVKALNEILIKTNPKSRVVYSKAGNVSEFRNDFNLVKSREVNDFHHAHDAYLNIVVGNTYNTKFGSNAVIFFEKNKDRDSFTNTKKLFDRDVPGAWKKNGDSIGIVRKMLSLKDVLVTKMALTNKFNFYDETIYPKDDKAELFPLKSKDKRFLKTEEYGGYNSLKIAYFMIVEHTVKKKRIISIEGIPVFHSYQINQKKMTIKDVLIGYLKLKDPKVIVDSIKIGTLIKVDKAYANLAGKSGNVIITHNSNQLYLGVNSVQYVKLIEKFLKESNNESKNGEDNIVVHVSKDSRKEDAMITKNKNLQLFDDLINKLKIELYKGLTIGNYYDELVKSREKFMEIGISDQVYSLMQLITMLQTNASTGDLSKFMQKASNKGSNTINKNITNQKIVIYDESITGFYRKVRWQNQ